MNNNFYSDGKIWTCRGGIPVHDTKFNIRKNSIYENIIIQIQILYIINLYCFIENLSLENFRDIANRVFDMNMN